MHVTEDHKVSAETVRERWKRAAVDIFIDEAIGQSGLGPIAQRSVVDLPDRLLFFQMIAESHISGHLMREYGWGWIDVFSCKPVNALEVGRAVQRHFTSPGDGLRVRVLGRGILPEGEPDGAHDPGTSPQVQED